MKLTGLLIWSLVFTVGVTLQCGGIFVLDRGMEEFTMTSPGYPENYPKFSQCQWTVISTINKKLGAEFLDFSVEDQNPCIYDKLLVDSDACNFQSPITLCGNSQPQPIESTGNMLCFRFLSDLVVNGRGFKVKVKLLVDDSYLSLLPGTHFTLDEITRRPVNANIPCDVFPLLITDDAIISSPGFGLGQQCPPNITCRWLLYLDIFHVAILKFTDVDIEDYDLCDSYSIQIIQGDETAPNFSQKLCGSQLLDPVTIYDPKLIMFTSDGMIQGQGFSASLKFVLRNFTSFPSSQGHGEAKSAVIGGLYTSASATRPAPSTPSVLASLSQEAGNPSEGETKISLSDPTNSSPHNKQTSSRAFSTSANSLSSTNNIPSNENVHISITTNTNKGTSDSDNTIMLLTSFVFQNFTKDVSSSQGHDEDVKSAWIDDLHTAAVATTFLTSPPSVLSFSMYSETTEITSNLNNFGHDSAYNTNTSQQSVSAYTESSYNNENGGKSILKNSKNNNNKHMSEAATSSKFELAARSTWNLPTVETIISASVISDSGHNSNSFIYNDGIPVNNMSGQFETINICSQTFYNLTLAHVVIQSPGFESGVYPLYIRCDFVVAAEPNTRLKVSFRHMDLENSEGCYLDWLQISTRSHSLGTFCGSVASDLQADDRMILVTFVSDPIVAKSGFQLQIDKIEDARLTKVSLQDNSIIAMCDSIFDVVDKDGIVMTSPGYSQSFYPLDTECDLKLFASSAFQKLKVTILNMDIEPHRACTYDYLIMYDGVTSSSSLARMCGNQTGNVIASSGPTIQVHFFSDHFVARKGFKLKVSPDFDNESLTVSSTKPSSSRMGETSEVNLFATNSVSYVNEPSYLTQILTTANPGPELTTQEVLTSIMLQSLLSSSKQLFDTMSIETSVLLRTTMMYTVTTGYVFANISSEVTFASLYVSATREISETREIATTLGKTELVEVIATRETTESVEVSETRETTESVEVSETRETTELVEVSETRETTESVDVIPTRERTELVKVSETRETTESVVIPTRERTEFHEISSTKGTTETHEVISTRERTETHEISSTKEIAETHEMRTPSEVQWTQTHSLETLTTPQVSVTVETSISATPGGYNTAAVSTVVVSTTADEILTFALPTGTLLLPFKTSTEISSLFEPIYSVPTESLPLLLQSSMPISSKFETISVVAMESLPSLLKPSTQSQVYSKLETISAVPRESLSLPLQPFTQISSQHKPTSLKSSTQVSSQPDATTTGPSETSHWPLKPSDTQVLSLSETMSLLQPSTQVSSLAKATSTIPTESLPSLLKSSTQMSSQLEPISLLKSSTQLSMQLEPTSLKSSTQTYSQLEPTSLKSSTQTYSQLEPTSLKSSTQISMQLEPTSLKSLTQISMQLEPTSLKSSTQISMQLEPTSLLKSSTQLSMQLEPTSLLKSSTQISMLLEPTSLKSSTQTYSQLEPTSLKSSTQTYSQLEPTSLKSSTQISMQLEPTSLKSLTQISMQLEPTSLKSSTQISMQLEPTSLKSLTQTYSQLEPTSLLKSSTQISMLLEPTSLKSSTQISMQLEPTSLKSSTQISMQLEPTSLKSSTQISMQLEPTSPKSLTQTYSQLEPTSLLKSSTQIYSQLEPTSLLKSSTQIYSQLEPTSLLKSSTQIYSQLEPTSLLKSSTQKSMQLEPTSLLKSSTQIYSQLEPTSSVPTESLLLPWQPSTEISSQLEPTFAVPTETLFLPLKPSTQVYSQAETTSTLDQLTRTYLSSATSEIISQSQTLTTPNTEHSTSSPTLSTLESACSGVPSVLTEKSGLIASPGFLQHENYPTDIMCNWIVEGQGRKISIQFQNFTLEYHPTCSYDFLEFYNVISGSQILIGRYCGQQFPDNLTSSGDSLVIVFVSDRIGRYAGFLLSYTIYEGVTYQSPCPSERVRCKDDQLCIPKQWLCDTERDCPLGDDEADCYDCGDDEFTCSDNTCLPMYHVCDDISNCNYGEDEAECVKVNNNSVLLIRKEGLWFPACANEWLLSDSMLQWACTATGQGNQLNAKSVTVLSPFYANLMVTQSNTTSIVNSQQTSGEQVEIHISSKCQDNKVVSLSCAATECGAENLHLPQPFILGSSSSVDGQWPWTVALFSGAEFKCGATLISRQWLVSAGHCVYNLVNSPQTTTARLGHVNIQSPDIIIIRIVEVIVHPQNNYIFENDISLLRLETAIEVNTNQRPVCLDSLSTEWSPYAACYVAGWGVTDKSQISNPQATPILHHAKISIWEQSKCERSYPGKIKQSMLCAGYQNGEMDACKGDSGGPLMCATQFHKWQLVGVVSWGEGCGEIGKPGVYTRVDSYLDWITTTTDEQVNYGVSCDFEYPNVCGYSSQSDSEFLWTRRMGGVSSPARPYADNTFKNSSGHYMYTYVPYGKKYKTAMLTSPLVGEVQTGYCVKGSVIIQDCNKCKFEVRITDVSGNLSQTLLQVTSAFTTNWMRFELDIPQDSEKINFLSTSGIYSDGGIGLDDVALAAGLCGGSKLLNCKFSKNSENVSGGQTQTTLCAYQQDTTDNFDWTVFYDSDEVGIIDWLADEAFIRAQSNGYPGDIARIISPALKTSISMCLMFIVRVSSINAGILTVCRKLYFNGIPTLDCSVWSSSASNFKLQTWVDVKVSISALDIEFGVVFQVAKGEGEGYIDVDNIYKVDGDCI